MTALAPTRTPGPNQTLGSIITSLPSIRVEGEIHACPDQPCSRLTALPGDGRAPARPLDFGEFSAGVATHHVFFRSLNGNASQAARTGNLDDVGQIILTLGIVIADRLKQIYACAPEKVMMPPLQKSISSSSAVGFLVLADRNQLAVAFESAVHSRLDQQRGNRARPRRRPFAHLTAAEAVGIDQRAHRHKAPPHRHSLRQ
jgi:hypothetical protein